MSVNPTQFVLEQLRSQADKCKGHSDFFEFLLNNSSTLEGVTFKLKNVPTVFSIKIDSDDNGGLIIKRFTQLFADAMDEFYQLQKENESKISALQLDSKIDITHLN